MKNQAGVRYVKFYDDRDNLLVRFQSGWDVHQRAPAHGARGCVRSHHARRHTPDGKDGDVPGRASNRGNYGRVLHSKLVPIQSVPIEAGVGF